MVLIREILWGIGRGENYHEGKPGPRRQCYRGSAVSQPRIYEDNTSDYGVAPRREREILEGILDPDRRRKLMLRKLCFSMILR
jgi:hypothetical protein